MGHRSKILSNATAIRAFRDVLAELEETGLLTDRLLHVVVVFKGITTGRVLGRHFERPSWFSRLRGFEPGMIHIPRASLAHWLDRLLGRRRPTDSLRSTLRHEFAHAFAREHPGLVRCREFAAVFGAPYDSKTSAQNPSWSDYVSTYAETNPAEDFAETFMAYLQVRGNIERFRRRCGVYAKLQFVGGLVGAATDKVVRLGITRQRGMLYFIRDGAVWKVPRSFIERPKGGPEKVVDVGLKQDKRYVYFLDRDGDITRAPREPAGSRGTKKAR